MNPPPVVPYSPEHHTDTNAQSPTDSLSQPDVHHSTHAEPQQPSHTHPRVPVNPDPWYQPNPHYPSPTDPRYPRYSERINHPDGRYSIYTTQPRPVYPDGRYLVTSYRRPPPPVPQTPVHHHASGPGVRKTTFKCLPHKLQFNSIPPTYQDLESSLWCFHSSTWSLWTAPRRASWKASAGQTSCASPRLRLSVWRVHSGPSFLQDYKISRASCAGQTGTVCQ